MSDPEARTSIEHRLEACLAGELQARVPELTWLRFHDKPVGEPPYGLVQGDEARETTPESGVFYVAVFILITHLIEEGSARKHAELVHKVRTAIESLPPGEDEDHGVRLYGLTIQQVVSADTTEENGHLFELNVGCGVMEKQQGGPVNTPNVEA